MYLGFLVDIPDVKGKITQKRKGNSVYISYEIGRKYDPAKQYNVPDRVIIGKQNQSDKKQMEPNENFLKYFPEVDLPEERYDSNRSSCLRIGAYIIIQQMMKETGIPELLSEYFNDRDLGLFLDLITYAGIESDQWMLIESQKPKETLWQGKKRQGIDLAYHMLNWNGYITIAQYVINTFFGEMRYDR